MFLKLECVLDNWRAVEQSEIWVEPENLHFQQVPGDVAIAGLGTALVSLVLVILEVSLI